MKRGEIYYISIPYNTGSEMAKNRPAVIVSCDALNLSSPVITVVYLTATPKHRTPGHVEINSSTRPSTALCEQIYTVDKSRVSSCIGEVTPDEMADIDAALMRTLGIEAPASEESDEEIVQNVFERSPTNSSGVIDVEELLHAVAECTEQRDKLTTELAVYKSLYERLLDRLTTAS